MMIYETPLFRPLGDCYLAVEFGDEADLLLNFRVLALADVLEREAIPGVIEIIPSFRELGIVFDRFETDHAALQETVAALQKTVSDVDQLPSRLVELPSGTTIRGRPTSPGASTFRRTSILSPKPTASPSTRSSSPHRHRLLSSAGRLHPRLLFLDSTRCLQVAQIAQIQDPPAAIRRPG